MAAKDAINFLNVIPKKVEANVPPIVIIIAGPFIKVAALSKSFPAAWIIEKTVKNEPNRIPIIEPISTKAKPFKVQRIK